MLDWLVLNQHDVAEVEKLPEILKNSCKSILNKQKFWFLSLFLHTYMIILPMVPWWSYYIFWFFISYRLFVLCISSRCDRISWTLRRGKKKNWGKSCAQCTCQVWFINSRSGIMDETLQLAASLFFFPTIPTVFNINLASPHMQRVHVDEQELRLIPAAAYFATRCLAKVFAPLRSSPFYCCD